MLYACIIMKAKLKLERRPTGSAPSLLVAESLRPFVRGGAIGDEGADFRLNGLRKTFIIR